MRRQRGNSRQWRMAKMRRTGNVGDRTDRPIVRSTRTKYTCWVSGQECQHSCGRLPKLFQWIPRSHAMGTFSVACRVENHTRRSRAARIASLLVDTGSEHTWISERALEKIGVKPEKRDAAFVMAKGKTVTRDIGFAIVR